MTERSRLARVLSEIGERWRDRLNLANEAIGFLPDIDWLLLAGWDFGATFFGLHGELRLLQADRIAVVGDTGESTIEIRSNADASNVDVLIVYTDANRYARLREGMLPPGAPEDHSAAALVSALAFSIYRLDSVLFLPRGLRNRRIEEEAEQLHLDSDRVRRLASWSSSIQRLLRELG